MTYDEALERARAGDSVAREAWENDPGAGTAFGHSFLKMQEGSVEPLFIVFRGPDRKSPYRPYQPTPEDIAADDWRVL